MSVEPVCPECQDPPMFEFSDQSICGNPRCKVFTWNPNMPYAEQIPASIEFPVAFADELPYQGVPPAPPSITCPVCGKTSYHPKDIENGYCGKCHDYTAWERCTVCHREFRHPHLCRTHKICGACHPNDLS